VKFVNCEAEITAWLPTDAQGIDANAERQEFIRERLEGGGKIF